MLLSYPSSRECFPPDPKREHFERGDEMGSSRVEKIGPNRYRVIHSDEKQDEEKKGKPWAITGKREPVPVELRDPDKSYCDCGRELNRGNKSGICIQCRESKS
jgi:hypothetical protein